MNRLCTVTNEVSGRRRRSHGVVLLIALVAVMMVSMVLVGLARLAIAQRDRLDTMARQRQAYWLAESAIERAAMRLAADTEYQGEAWQLSPAALGSSRESARVTIEVDRHSTSGQYLIRAAADFPDHRVHRARKTLERMVRLPRPTAEKTAGRPDGQPAQSSAPPAKAAGPRNDSEKKP